MNLYDRFGSREMVDITFRAKSRQKIGNRIFEKHAPVILLDSGKTSSLDGDATTVYAQGGVGYNKLLAWEGEKSVTFTFEDALMSPLSLAMLIGAEITEADQQNTVHVPQSSEVLCSKEVIGGKHYLVADLTEELKKEKLCYKKGTLFGSILDGNGLPEKNLTTDYEKSAGKKVYFNCDVEDKECYVKVDYYIYRNSGATVMEILPDKFAGYYYVEGKTLYRNEATGLDYPAIITIPKVKIQSKFSIPMSGTGDPASFTFTMDAFKDKTPFSSKPVLATLAVIEDTELLSEEEDENTPCVHDDFRIKYATVDGENKTLEVAYVGNEGHTYAASNLTINGVDKTAASLVTTGTDLFSISLVNEESVVAVTAGEVVSLTIKESETDIEKTLNYTITEEDIVALS